MFEKADKNGDGKLTKTEWMDVLRQSGVPVTEFDILILSIDLYQSSL